MGQAGGCFFRLQARVVCRRIQYFRRDLLGFQIIKKGRTYLKSQISSLDFIFEGVKLGIYCNAEVCYGKKISI